MNWTGGSLQRTKHANKGTLQKQKAYFARARTHLENGSHSPVVPFRPSYLQNDENFELGNQIPPFGSGSVRHTVHSSRHRRRVLEREADPEDGVSDAFTHKKAVEIAASSRALQRPPSTSQRLGATPKAQQREKTQASGDTLEAQLLEGNKLRLLKQNDWIGVAPSKPVNLRFQTRKEKVRIGKRRKVLGRHHAAVKRTDQTNFDSQRAQPADNHHTVPFMPYAIRNDLEDLRIRIGTDAITTACSTQHNECNQSYASSDPMLFDQPDQDREHHEMHGLEERTIPGPQTLGHTAQNGDAAPYKLPVAYGRSRPYHNHQTFREMSAQSMPEQDGAELDQCVSKKKTAQTVEVVTPRHPNTPGLRITQQVGGTKHPFRLVFDATNSSIGARSCSHDDGDGGTIHAREARYAGPAENRLTRSFGSIPELSCNNEATIAAATHDEELWHLYLAIPEHSSIETPRSRETELGVVHQQAMSKHEDARTSWSQHATQGDQSRISSSLISASLPSLNRVGRYRAPVDGPPASFNKGSVREMDESERLWEGFVLGNNETSSEEGKQHLERELTTWASSYLPLSVAVSSISSTPAPLMHDATHNTPRLAPCTSFPTISSPAMRPTGSVERLGKYGDKTAERTAYGNQSVTHASLQNNPSSTSLLSSRMFSDIGTSGNGPNPLLQKAS